MTSNNNLKHFIALQERADHILGSVKFSRIFNKSLSPAAVISQTQAVISAIDLYKQCYRMCRLIKENKDSNSNMPQICESISRKINRLEFAHQKLREAAKMWGIGSEESIEELPITIDKPYQAPALDSNYVDDFEQENILRTTLKKSLNDLRDIIDYMELPTLLKIKSRIDKLGDM